MRRPRTTLVTLLALPVVLTACAATGTIVPPVSPGMVAAAPHGDDAVVLERGRRIYLTACARCHAPIPIARHTASEWKALMPEMVAESRLDPEDDRAVNAYVLAARASLDTSPD